MSTVAWMSFDAEQRRRTDLFLQALSSSGTLDELGFGQIRDLISGVLHPGLTSLMTRAGYLLFVPWIYRSLDGTDAELLLKEGRRLEGRLAGHLIAFERGNEQQVGIIGRRTGELARQPASTTYWGLIRRLEIVLAPGGVTAYCDAVAGAARDRRGRRSLHSEDEMSLLAATAGLWTELPHSRLPPGGRSAELGDFTGFGLTEDESEFLRDRFLLAERHVPEGERSLLHTFLSRQEWVTGVEYPWEHPLAVGTVLPPVTAHVLQLAEAFDRSGFGARILYNYLCADKLPASHDEREDLMSSYAEAMASWIDERRRRPLPETWLADLDRWARRRFTNMSSPNSRMARWAVLHRFLAVWEQRAQTSPDLLNDRIAIDLISGREAALKPGRARLTTPDGIVGWEGSSSYFHLDYNWAVARRLMQDIHMGLGSDFVSGEGD